MQPLPQPNLEKWKFFLKDYSSPDSFIEFGYYALISACLQRRVWNGMSHMILYPNTFIVFCAEAGIGKGLILKTIARALTHNKMLKIPHLMDNKLELENEVGPLPEANSKRSTRVDNMLIPTSPRAITFEALVNLMSNCSRALWFPTGKVTVEGKVIRKPQFHCSLFVLLDELGSFFKKGSHTEDLHVFLNEVYDCGDEFEYKTKHQGTDIIRRPCVSLLAGATPSFLKRVFSSQLLQEGFASRTIMLVENKRRFRYYEPPPISEEQAKAYEEVIDWIKSIATIQGEVKWTEEAKEFNRQWYEIDYAKQYPNPHPSLKPYYERINITHAKLAMAIHFGESNKMELDLACAEKALMLLQKVENTMHRAVGLEQRNPLSQVTDEIEQYINSNGRSVSKKQLITQFYHSFPADPWEDINKIIQYLKESGKIKDDDTGKANSYMKIIEVEDK